MSEPVRRGTFVANIRELEHLAQSSPPSVDDRIETLRAADQEWLFPNLLDTRGKAIAQPIGNVGEDIAAVLLGMQKDLITVKSLDVEEDHVGDPEAGIHQ